MKFSLNNKLTYIPFFLISVVYFILATKNIYAPGLSYDEVNYVNITQDIKGNGFYLTIFDIPLYTMQYIGGFKAYFYKFIYSLFGVDMISIRLPLIIVGFLSAFLVYLAAQKIFKNYLVSSLIVLIMLLDSTYIIQHRFDLGPVVFELFFKSIALYLMVSLIYNVNNINLKFLFFLFIILVLGLYNKLNFIWFINALYLSFLMSFYNQYQIFTLYDNYNLTINLKKILIISLPYIILAIGFVFIYKYFNISNVKDLNLTNRINYFQTQLPLFFNATSFTNSWLTRFSPNFSSFYMGISILFLALSIFSLFKKELQKIYIFYVFLLVFMLLQIFITPNADKSWHLFSLYPIYHLLLGFGIYNLFSFVKQKKIIIVLCSILFLFIGYYHINNFLKINLSSTFKENTSISSFGRTVPSMSIYGVSDFVETLPKGSVIVSTDWGSNNQLQLLNPDYTLLERTWHLNANKNLDKVILPLQNYYYIVHSDLYVCFPNSKNNFFNYISKNNYTAEIVEKIYEDGFIAYEIYQVKKGN